MSYRSSAGASVIFSHRAEGPASNILLLIIVHNWQHYKNKNPELKKLDTSLVDQILEVIFRHKIGIPVQIENKLLYHPGMVL